VPGEASFAIAGERAAQAIVDPLEDPNTSAQYRRDLVRVVTQRALTASLTT
jgi:hypothetical protein